jgi:hypothetical protein
MKHIITTVITFFFVSYAMSQSPTAGQVKITLQSFKCINKSWDGFVEFDGHGNEVSVAYSARIYNPSNPNNARRFDDGTVIYGSNVNGMTRAGTQTPDLGGINNGDVVNVFKTLIDAHMDADDILVLAPNVWEWDGPEKRTIGAFNGQLEKDLDWVIRQNYPFANVAVSNPNPFADRTFKIFDKYSYGQALKYHMVFREFLCPANTQGNRVMGIDAGPFNGECLVAFAPRLLVLDTRALFGQYLNNRPRGTSHAEKESATPFVDGVTITYTEGTYSVTTSNGSYSITLKIEFTPDAPAATTSGGLTGTPTKNPGIVKTQRNAIIKGTITPSVVGIWSGTQTTSSGLYPQAVNFELTGYNEFIMANQSTGAIACRGTYTFANNTISGSYKQLSSGETYSFTGSFDSNTQKMICTIGAGTSVTGQGKWEVTKK